MTRYLPVALNLEGRTVLVVGAGAIGSAKALDFLDCGAQVTVISPDAAEAIRDAAEAGRIRWVQRRYQPNDAAGYFFVMVSTDDPDTNTAVFVEASARGQLINVCDDPAHCNVIFASRLERGQLTVSIFTHGSSPALSKRVRRELERVLGPEYADLARWLAEVRPQVLALPGVTQPQRQQLFEQLVYSDVLYLLAEGRREEARQRFEAILQQGLMALAAGESDQPS
jgi:precorrin-2 dehydrogenase/sirohydrochlorin ferrochelatase